MPFTTPCLGALSIEVFNSPHLLCASLAQQLRAEVLHSGEVVTAPQMGCRTRALQNQLRPCCHCVWQIAHKQGALLWNTLTATC